MSLAQHGMLPYVAVLIAAIVEGEVTYIGAATLVADGQLNALGVLVSGAVGAAIGDQVFFYAFRGRLPRWTARYPALHRRAAPLVDRVRRHAPFMVLLIRFAPGLRIAIAAACALAEISPWTVSVVNLISAFVWAAALLVLIAWFGPSVLTSLGLEGWKGALVIGLVLFASLKAFGAYERHALERPLR
jgi:membrane protein DedA with SNARE-associated domain